MTTSLKNVFAVALLASVIAGGAMAQDATPPVATPSTPATPAMTRADKRADEVNAREVKEQNRINKGVADGKLTPTEDTRVQGHLNKIEAKTTADEAKNGGGLTKKEAVKLNGRENKESKRIHKLKTNDKTAPVAPVAQ